MANQYKQIIPDSQSVARLLDPDALKILGLHSTFTIEELFGEINQTSIHSLQASFFIRQIKIVSNYGPPDFYRDINNALKPLGKSMSEGESSLIFRKIRNDDDYTPLNFFKDIATIASPKTETKSILDIFLSGANVSLLSLNGQGWQKGKLKICFEFIPEENELITMKEDVLETTRSPLDEIRQLANSLSNDQN
jgi:KGK domain